MDVHQLLREVAARGIVLERQGHNLGYRALRGALTSELRTQILAHKPALLVLLASQGTGGRPNAPCRSCGTQTWWERPAHHGGGWVCGKCHPDPEVLYAAWLAQRGGA